MLEGQEGCGQWFKNKGILAPTLTPLTYADERHKRLIMQYKISFVEHHPSLKLLFQKSKIFIQVSKKMLLRPPQECIPEPEASVMINMLYGQQAILPTDISHSFAVMGMQHILVASGSNLNIVLQLTNVFTRHFGPFKRLGLSISLLTIWWYAFLTDMEAPVVRAAGMASIYLVSRQFHKAYHAGYALLLTVTIMLMHNPQYIHSLSFQLSVLATASIIFVLPQLHTPGLYAALETSQSINLSGGQSSSLFAKIKAVLLESFYVTVAVQLTITPLLMHKFGQLNAFSLLANTFLICSVPIISGLAVVLTSVFYIAKMWIVLEYVSIPLLGSLGWMMIHGLLTVATWSEVGQPFLFILKIPGWSVATWWGLLICLIFRTKNKKIHYENWHN